MLHRPYIEKEKEIFHFFISLRPTYGREAPAKGVDLNKAGCVHIYIVTRIPKEYISYFCGAELSRIGCELIQSLPFQATVAMWHCASQMQAVLKKNLKKIKDTTLLASEKGEKEFREGGKRMRFENLKIGR